MMTGGAKRVVRRLASVLGAVALAVVGSAHVGSPNVFFVGKAGAYDVDVVVRPPQVVPGLAEITVRVPVSQGSSVRQITVRPVFWQTGTRGSPAGDVAAKLDASEPTWAGKLWLMAGGAYSVYVTIDGTLGKGTAVIPVAAVAMARLQLGRPLTILLVVLGLFLVVGLATIVRAAASEGLVPPGQQESPAIARRGRLATAIALPVLALALLGGWKWWDSTARAYERTLYAPLAVQAWVNTSDAARTLTLSITDSAYRAGLRARIFPDHGKLMHMFLVREPELDAFAHLHPAMPDENTFRTAVPGALPAGTYRVYGDVVHESGFQRTLIAKVNLPAPSSASATASDGSSGDDAWTTGGERGALTLPRASVRLSDGRLLTWTSDGSPLTAGRETSLKFDVTDSAGTPVPIETYLGMAAHAVVMRDDGSVFIHLHPMGTVSAAAVQAFSLRERGDTNAKGRLVLADSGGVPAMAMPTRTSSFAIPYAFPKPGRYKLWVQVKRGGRVLTGAFDADVAAP